MVGVKVPDIGDFKDIPVIEVFVAGRYGEGRGFARHAGIRQGDDAVASAGTVQAVKVKLGDKVSEGSVIVVDAEAGAVAAALKRHSRKRSNLLQPPPRLSRQRPWLLGRNRASVGMPGRWTPRKCSSRPGPMVTAAFRAADLGMKTVLVERYATLGGVCLNVG